MKADENELKTAMEGVFDIFSEKLESFRPGLKVEEVGTVAYVGPGVVKVTGLKGARSHELLRFKGDLLGMAFNLDSREAGVVMLDKTENLESGDDVERTGRVLDVPVGESLLGRVIDALGRPLDNRGATGGLRRLPIERPAHPIMDRLPVTVPLQTGLKVIDALIPIGKGQRELIVGDRQTGKTAIAVDTIINQKGKDVRCVYCAIGKRSSAVAKVISDLRQRGAMDYSIVIVATEEDPPGLQFATAYSAMTIGENFMEGGKDVLVVFDDLTRHARAYRELSLLLRRPPGREAYPGDIFYIHSRLLERSTHLREDLGGGSLTALPIIETEAQNISAYIPTNLISITDGQIYLSPELFQKGLLPAVDVGKSVSRVGGKTQLKAYRAVAGDLRLSYSQFEELETFARFGTQMDEETRKTLERGRRVRQVLKQPQYSPLRVFEQIAVLVALNEGVFDRIPVDDVGKAEEAVRKRVAADLSDLGERIEAGEKIEKKDIQRLAESAKQAVEARL